MPAATATRRTVKATAAIAAALTLPKLAKGEIYVGAVVGPDGKGEHVILLAGDKDKLTWTEALEWAKAQGGDLPNRVEQALLFADQRAAFKRDWYWSNTQHADDERWAWSQHFSYGSQGCNTKASKLRARAVRRVSIQPLALEAK